MQRSTRSSGFTLIELSLVTGMIGMLAAIAIPAYQDYTIRARVSEGLQLAAPVQLAMVQYYDRWGEFPPDNAAAGLPAPRAVQGQSTESIAIERDTIVIRYRDSTWAHAADNTLTIVAMADPTVPSAPIRWACGHATHATRSTSRPATETGTTLPDRYLPGTCRTGYPS